MPTNSGTEQCQWVGLTNGRTHYQVHQLDGDSDGPWVVLVHGLVTPMFAWASLAEALASAGFRVLRYDHFGRGHSDYPKIRYDHEVYVRQLEELLAALSIDGPVHLMGWSMGGVIGCTYTRRHPDRVATLAMIAPGLFFELHPALRLFIKTPLFPLFMRLTGRRFIAKTQSQHFTSPNRFLDYQRQLDFQLQNPAFFPCLASTIRNFPMGSGPEFSSVGRQDRPILLVWGDRDEAVPYANLDRVRGVFPAAEVLTVEGAGHAPHYEYPEVVNPVVTRFLEGGTPKAS